MAAPARAGQLAREPDRGDDGRAESLAARLIRDSGFEPVDAGPLGIARYIEPFTMLVGRLA